MTNLLVGLITTALFSGLFWGLKNNKFAPKKELQPIRIPVETSHPRSRH